MRDAHEPLRFFTMLSLWKLWRKHWRLLITAQEARTYTYARATQIQQHSGRMGGTMTPLVPVNQKVREMWEGFDSNEKHGIRFGLFPSKEMREAEKEGYTFRELSLGLMEIASRDGGMRA
jgi:hypothetical protein